MGYQISTEPDRRMIVVKTSGDLKATEFYEMIRQTSSLSTETGIKTVLVDHSSSTVKNMSQQEIYIIAKTCVVANDSLAGGKMAVLLSGIEDMTLGRIWLCYAEDELSFASRLFSDHAEALAWLEADSAT